MSLSPSPPSPSSPPRFPEPDGDVKPPIIGFHDVDFGYPGGPTLFRDLNFGLDLESRFAIVGEWGGGSERVGEGRTEE